MTKENLDDFKQITGEPWSGHKRVAWLFSVQAKGKSRDYLDIVDRMVTATKHNPQITMHEYGEVAPPYHDYGTAPYCLYWAEVGDFSNGKPIIVVIGGVHGYEPSGVLSAIEQIEQKEFAPYLDQFNFAVIPNVSPFGWEYDERWNAEARDPNRTEPLTKEMRCVLDLLSDIKAKAKGQGIYLINDRHETLFERDKILRVMRASQEGKSKPSDEAINSFVDGLHIMITKSDDPVVFGQRIDVANAMLSACEELTQRASNETIAGYKNANGVVAGNEQGITGRNAMQALAQQVMVMEVVPNVLGGPHVQGDEKLGLVSAVEVQKAALHGALEYARNIPS